MQRKQYSRHMPRKQKKAKKKVPPVYMVAGRGFARIGRAAEFAYNSGPPVPRGEDPPLQITHADGSPLSDFSMTLVRKVYHGFANYTRMTGDSLL